MRYCTGYLLEVTNNNITWYGSLSGNASTATNADKLDDYHEYSFLRYRGATSTNQEGTLWSQIGIKQYHNCFPDGISGIYPYGETVSLAGADCRLELHTPHTGSDVGGSGIYWRSGWGNDKRPWANIFDSNHDAIFTGVGTGSR